MFLRKIQNLYYKNQYFTINLIYVYDTFKKKYRLLVSELGLHVGYKENYSADIAGYDREKVTAKMLAQPNYLTIPPTFVVEVPGE